MGFIPVEQFEQLDYSNLKFRLLKNNQLAQQGNSGDMIFDVASLVSEISHHFSLFPGDIVLTGTPAGVSALDDGDTLALQLFSHTIARAVVKVKG